MLYLWENLIKDMADLLDLTLQIQRNNEENELEYVFLVAWCIWFNRNKLSHGEGSLDPKVIVGRVDSFM